MWETLNEVLDEYTPDEIKREINLVSNEASNKIHRLTKQLEELERQKRELLRPKGKKMITLYAHRDKESNYDTGETLGLDGDALDNFAYTLYEVKFDIELDCETGDTKIIKVDGIPLNYEGVN